MKFIFLFSLLSIVSCSTHQKVKTPKHYSPKIAFTASEGILHPESVLYSHERQAIFVSNVASGNPVETKRVGYISKLSPKGEVLVSKWVSGLKAPKGMVIVGKFLFVSDVNQLVKIDIDKAKIVQTINVPKAKFLNDVIADKNGNVYVSDMFTNKIHVLNKKGLRTWFSSSELKGPNGLYTDGTEHIIAVTWGGPIDSKTFATGTLGGVYSLSLKNKNDSLVMEESLRGNLDGISADAKGQLWVSDWMNGNVHLVKKNGSSTLKYNFGQGTADISVAKELNLLLIPQMNTSRVIAVEIID